MYQANDLYRLRHNLQIKPDEKDNFFESDLYKDNEKLRNIKFYDVEQLDKTSFDKLPPEIKPEKYTTISSQMLDRTLDIPRKKLAEKFISHGKITSQDLELED
ncbi:hypothetical protein J3U57_07145 [Gilliamella sp. B3464]|uniref:hypothetical protein n=1 Tax=unclassified Gilliamella TaxID=2685620 RepID=UPI00226A3FE7|nr:MULTISPECIES: hypothetical protein [unclassified Gilliamella]MCX8712112.1 hypothetical protein [Gilliamella sp. B3468]MCX8751343.1 hypothetical protein [Gilliamella sp. B3464]